MATTRSIGFPLFSQKRSFFFTPPPFRNLLPSGPLLLPPLPGPPPRAPRRHARQEERERRLPPGRPGRPVLAGARRVRGRRRREGEDRLCRRRRRGVFLFFLRRWRSVRGERRRLCSQQLPPEPAGGGHRPHQRADERRRRRRRRRRWRGRGRGRGDLELGGGRRGLWQARRRPRPEAIRAASEEGQRGVSVVHAPGE